MVRIANCVSDGVTDVTACLQAEINATNPNETLIIPPSNVYYRITGPLTINKPMDVVGQRAQIWQVTSNQPGLKITSGNVSILGLQLVGPQYATSKVDEKAIWAEGPSAANPLTGININSCNLASWGQNGVYLKYVTDFVVTRNIVQNIYLSGIGGLSVVNGIIDLNRVINVVGAPNVYGINMTRITADPGELTSNPRSSNILITRNRIEGIPNWEGIDTHGGTELIISQNRVFGCKRAIVVTNARNNAGVDTYAPKNVIISDNLIDSRVTDGSLNEGIVVSGAGAVLGSAVEYAEGCKVSGNEVRGHGLANSAAGFAFYFLYTRGLSVFDNTLIEPGKHGMYWYHDNREFNCQGNTIQDCWSDTLQTIGINMASGYNTGYCSGNSFLRGAKTAAKIFDIGLNIFNDASNRITWVKDNWNPLDLPAPKLPVVDGGGRRV